jgi:hypothetical protein
MLGLSTLSWYLVLFSASAFWIFFRVVWGGGNFWSGNGIDTMGIACEYVFLFSLDYANGMRWSLLILHDRRHKFPGCLPARMEHE